MDDTLQVFERLDVEGDGLISVNELEQVVKQEGLECAQEDVVRLLQGIDIDGSNSLNYREFLAATMEVSNAEGLTVRGEHRWVLMVCLLFSFVV